MQGKSPDCSEEMHFGPEQGLQNFDPQKGG